MKISFIFLLLTFFFLQACKLSDTSPSKAPFKEYLQKHRGEYQASLRDSRSFKKFKNSRNLKSSKNFKDLIRKSISQYSGSCPCPYSTDRAGRKCGKRSAHSRAGGNSPLCYESDF